MGLSSGMGSRQQEERARLGHLAHGNGELARPLAQEPKLPFHRGELLQDVGCVHGLAPEVVGDAVQGVDGLVLLVAPLVELVVEAVRAGEVENHVTPCSDVLRRQLQEQPHERGCGNVQCAYERPCALLVCLANAHVQASVESFHGLPKRREAARLARATVRASQGCGASPARERIACARARAPVARHPGGEARHRSGSAMGSASGADKRYPVRCAHKIGCLLRKTIINAYIDSRLALIYHLHRIFYPLCPHV